jgi:hypothetical protein
MRNLHKKMFIRFYVPLILAAFVMLYSGLSDLLHLDNQCI